MNPLCGFSMPSLANRKAVVAQPRFGNDEKPKIDKAEVDKLIKDIPTHGNPDADAFLRNLAGDLLQNANRIEIALENETNRELEKAFGSLKQIADPDSPELVEQAAAKIIADPAEAAKLQNFIQEIRDGKAGKPVAVPAGSDPMLVRFVRVIFQKSADTLLPILEELTTQPATFAKQPDQLKAWSQRYYQAVEKAAKAFMGNPFQ